MNADGSNRVRVGDWGLPKWSPDSPQLLLVSFTNPCELALLEVPAGKEQPVAVGDKEVFSVPSWAGDGKTLVAVVRQEKSPVEVVLLDIAKPDAAKIAQLLWKRGTGLAAEPILFLPVIDFDHDAVDFIGKTLPHGLDLGMEGDHLLD